MSLCLLNILMGNLIFPESSDESYKKLIIIIEDMKNTFQLISEFSLLINTIIPSH